MTAGRYRVHIGFTLDGRNRWARFTTLDAASLYCEQVRQRTGIILSIMQSVRENRS